VKLSYNTIELTARRVFRTARSTTATSGSVIVTLSDGTITGIGEASPSRFYGETTETVLRYLERMRPAVDAAANESELMAELMSRGGKENPAARASLEIAAHDMMGKRCGAPLYAHFGLDPRATPLSTMSIGIDQPEVMLEKALEAKGFPLLKVKLDRETDASIVEKIKGATGAGRGTRPSRGSRSLSESGSS
jgi:L-alanine-DL-glutamate epimerase-like enolase superfamily enzyme